MATLIGTSSSCYPCGVVVDRTIGGTGGYIQNTVEEQFETDAGLAHFRYGVDRRHYLQMGDIFPPNINATSAPSCASAGGASAVGRLSGHALADFENNRLPLTNHRSGWTWAQQGAASPSVNVGFYNDVVATGDSIAAWQASHAGVGKWGATFCWAYEPEPNTGDDIANQGGGDINVAASNWRDGLANVWDIWVNTCGVMVWSGTSDGVTTSEGIIPALNLVAGEVSGHNLDWDVWWAEDSWMNQNMVLAAADAYNPPTRFKTFEFCTRSFKTFCAAKKITKANLGLPFLQGVWETGCQEIENYATIHASWTQLNPAWTPTKSNWYLQRAEFIRTSWPDLHHLADFDSDVGTVGGWRIDSEQDSWDAYVVAHNDPIFLTADSPLPSPEPPGITLIHNEEFNTDSTAFTTTSFVRAGLPTLICIETAQPDPSEVPVVNAGQLGTTWSLVRSVQTANGTVRRRATIYYGIPAGGASTLTINSSTQQQNCIVHVVQLDLTGGDVIRQTAVTTDTGVFGAQTIDFSVAVDPASSTMTWVVHNNNSGITEGSGYLLLEADTSTSPVTSAASAWIDSADDPADYTITGSTGRSVAGIALEIGSANTTVAQSGFGYLI